MAIFLGLSLVSLWKKKDLGKLMTLAEEWAIENGYFAVGLNVFSKNTRALGLYESMGYKTETLKMMKLIQLIEKPRGYFL